MGVEASMCHLLVRDCEVQTWLWEACSKSLLWLTVPLSHLGSLEINQTQDSPNAFQVIGYESHLHS